MHNRHHFMAEDNIFKLLLQFSIPAMIGMLVNATYNVIDRIFIGHIKDIGAIAISAIGIVLPLTIFVFSFTLLISLGSAANISLNLGNKNLKKAEVFLAQSLVMGFITALILCLVINFNLTAILTLLGCSQDTLPHAEAYTRIITWGYVPLLIGFIANSAIRADGNPKIAMFTLLLGTIINIILDPIFIFLFNLGVAGAAYATVIAQLITAIWTIYYFLSKHSYLKIRKQYFRLKAPIVLRILALGSAPFATQLGMSATGYVMNIFLKQYGGDLSIGAYAIIGAIITFFILPIIGINQGIQPLLGYNYGARLYHRVKKILFTAIVVASIICILGFMIIQIFPTLIIKIFTSDPQLTQMAVYGIRKQLLFLPLVGFQIICSIYFQAVGKPKMSLFMSLARQVIILIPCIIILSSLWGINGIWFAAPCSDLISFLLTLLFINKELKNLKKMENKETLTL